MSATENINRIATSVLDKYRSAIPRKAFKQAMAAITAEVGKPDPAPATSSRPIYDMTLLCRASFPATLETDGRPCIAEVTVYRLNAVAAKVGEIVAILIERMKPVVEAAAKILGSLWDKLGRAVAPPKWWHLYKHSKKARVRKKYRKRIGRLN